MSYFNETGPIYQEEHVQAKEFVKLVHAHVVVTADKNSNVDTSSARKETARFDWEAFHAAVASLRASDLSTEHDFSATIPQSADPTTTGNNIADTTVQAVLDALVARFASTDVLFIDGDENPKSHFFDTLRKNIYHAFTRHLEASEVPERERFLSFHGCTRTSAVAARSAWEYRLLFTYSDRQLGTVKGLVMTVTLEGSFGDKEKNGEVRGGKEAWYGVSLDSRGPFSGALRAMQVVVGEGFRCP